MNPLKSLSNLFRKWREKRSRRKRTNLIYAMLRNPNTTPDAMERYIRIISGFLKD